MALCTQLGASRPLFPRSSTPLDEKPPKTICTCFVKHYITALRSPFHPAVKRQVVFSPVDAFCMLMMFALDFHHPCTCIHGTLLSAAEERHSGLRCVFKSIEILCFSFFVLLSLWGFFLFFFNLCLRRQFRTTSSCN